MNRLTDCPNQIRRETCRVLMACLLGWLISTVAVAQSRSQLETFATESSLSNEHNPASLTPQQVVQAGEVSSPVGEQTCFVVRPSDTFWEISSRRLGNCDSRSSDFLCQQFHSPQHLSVHRLTGGHWNHAQLQDLMLQLQVSAEGLELHGDRDLQKLPQTRLVIYVHGNWTSGTLARQRAISVYRQLTARDEQPLNFVLYSWPSEREDGFARDVLHKKTRLDVESFLLACLLADLSTDVPVSMLGFSFGGPILCGALHLDAGGQLAGRSVSKGLASPDAQLGRDVRLSLTAPAFDRAALHPGGRYGLALCNVQQLVNLYNSQDPVLKRFRFYDRRSAPVAAGFAGLPSLRILPTPSGQLADHPRLVQYDCSRAIGRTHTEIAYLRQCSAFQHSLDNLLGR